MEPERIRPDICVIGAGSGGLSVAAAAAAFGVEVVLVERGLMGGDCLHVGCVPSKSLIAAARHAALVRDAARFGVHAGAPEIRFAEVRDHLRRAIAAIAPHDSAERFEGLGVRVVKAEARFRDARTLTAGGIEITARRFVIATGSRPAIPNLPGLAEAGFLTNETLFDLPDLPRHLAILGGGPIGAEMAQAFRRLGAAVTLIQRGTILPAEDPDLVAVVREALLADGVEVHEDAEAIRVEPGAGGPALLLRAGGRERRIEASHLLVAAGRQPTLAPLDPGAAGIRLDERGRLVLGPDLRTTNRRVYAVGDAAGGPLFTHAAGHEAGLVVRALLFRLPIRRSAGAMPRAIFTDPPLAQVGLAAHEAIGRPGLQIHRFPVARLDRAVAEGRTEGELKLVTGRGGRLLGAGFVGLGADEAMNLFALAVAKKLTLRDLAGFVSPYPTIGEIGKRAAGESFRPVAANRWLRAAIGLLRRLG